MAQGSRRPGRPRLDDTRRRSDGVFLRLSPTEREQLSGLAKSAGMTFASYLRASGLKQRLHPRTPVLDLHLLGELNRLGNNLNQALVLAHTHRAPHDLLPAAEALLVLLAEIRQALAAPPKEDSQ